MISLKQFVTEAYNVWTHAEKPVDAAKKHIADLKAQGHKILGTDYKSDLHRQMPDDGRRYSNASILSQDSKGRKMYHSISDVDKDKPDPRISKTANSTRVMRGATKMHMSMKGKFHSDLS